MVEKGLEVIFETARIWIQIGNFFNGEFHIHEVTGPDEYTAIVSDNYFTNMMAKFNLEIAYKLYNYFSKVEDEVILEKFRVLVDKINLSEEEIEIMKKASDNMLLLYNSNLDIYAQDSTFLSKPMWNLDFDKRPLLLYYHPLTIYRYQILKQADVVLAHLLLEEYADLKKMENSYNYYEEITTHDSSLSYCIYGIMACRYKFLDKAYYYFIQSISLDLHDTHQNTKDGLHLANIGGTVLSIIQGFAGLRLQNDKLIIRPSVPEQWEGYSFKINFRDCVLEVKVKEEIIIRLIVGDQMNLLVYDKEYKVVKDKELRIPLAEDF
jgi:alpha,alpha-trehalose phosphorylase